ncbi:MAG: acyl carrier protein [Bacteroidales bacterium]|nr:acyl carrier protein [Bacteroidales bacterium]MCF8344274.1 acyl carrier protein [Bacteroidales bacterium]MCF8351656.1 acyl carrier protein [Bacteroidales bacterium]MCF8375521.1 acyl carrier protein [Bacteroidales bacterium]MCF8399920.1 acyl carrier protein [Bacteroidales bacterium]
MKEKDIRQFVSEFLSKRLESVGLSAGDIRGSFDFIQSGLLDSMAFVDMISAMEEHFGVEIDFEEEVADNNFTNMKGLTQIFLKKN